MGDGGIADDEQVRTEHSQAGVVAVLAAGCLAAAIAGATVAVAVLNLVDIVHPF